MIRARREEDLDRLCTILDEMRGPSSPVAGRDAREWLLEGEAQVAWVFDQAPVSVAPTRNVVGHVQVQALPERPDVLAIGKLFVKPQKHEHGIARFFLREAVRHIHGHGRLAAVDLRQCWYDASFYERAGFRRETDAGSDHVLVRR